MQVTSDQTFAAFLFSQRRLRSRCVDFPSVKSQHLLRVLKRAPLNYRVVHQTGSHRKLESASGYPPIAFSFHDGVTVPSGLVRRILVSRVGLTEADALDLL
jgi:predicted RNA binding protein YcfA (HicA-like mRNA interferase family)